MSLPETGECIATTPESGRCSVLNFEIRDILCPFLKPMMYCIAPFCETGGCTVPHSEIWDICASSWNLWHVISRFIHVIKLWAINNSYSAFLACFVLSEIDNSNRSDIRFGYLFTAPPLKTWVSIACGLGGGECTPFWAPWKPLLGHKGIIMSPVKDKDISYPLLDWGYVLYPLLGFEGNISNHAPLWTTCKGCLPPPPTPSQEL